MTSPKTLFSWLLGPWRTSPTWRVGVIVPIMLLVSDIATRNVHPALSLLGLVVSSVGLANDLSWGVVLEEEQMLMGGFSKKPIARREDVQSAYVSNTSFGAEEYVELVLRGREDYRIKGSAANSRPEVWAREINRWAQGTRAEEAGVNK